MSATLTFTTSKKEICGTMIYVYLNDFRDKDTARKYVDRGISLANKRYSAAQIDKLVNGNDFKLVDLAI